MFISIFRCIRPRSMSTGIRTSCWVCHSEITIIILRKVHESILWLQSFCLGINFIHAFSFLTVVRMHNGVEPEISEKMIRTKTALIIDYYVHTYLKKWISKSFCMVFAKLPPNTDRPNCQSLADWPVCVRWQFSKDHAKWFRNSLF